MKILLTGGGTGGHFYPLIAVAEEINRIAREERLVQPKLYYAAPTQYDEAALFENGIEFKKIPAGKVRRYFSFKNVSDLFVTIWGILRATWMLLFLRPQVIFSKGGFASVPITVAAKGLRIPVIIHESDARPGRANKLAANWARRIAVSFPESAQYFPAKAQKNIAHTGTPIRRELHNLEAEGARELLQITDEKPVVLVLTGSTGSQYINDTVVDALPQLVGKYHIIHQTGKNLIQDVQARSSVVLNENEHKDNYHPYPFLDPLNMKRAASVASVIISRSGAGAISEFALWGKPAILIPIPEDVSHDQSINALTYANTGAAVVLQQANMTPGILTSQITRIAEDQEIQKQMGEAAKTFARPDAGTLIAEELIRIAKAKLNKA